MSYPTSVEARNPGCLLQLVWFVFIGVWLTPIWVAVAWVLMVTVVGIPIGVMMLNRVPQVLALRDPSEVRLRARPIGGGAYLYERVGVEQAPFLVRAVYFLLVGWWLSLLWMGLAYLVCCTLIGLPLGIWMFDLVPVLVSLRR